MSKGSYRGGSTVIGWNANRFVAPDNRKSRKAGEDVAKTPDEAANANELARANFGFRRKKKAKPEPAPLSPEREVEAATASGIEKLRKLLVKKRKGSPTLPVAVEVKRPPPSSEAQIAKLERLARRRAKEGDPLKDIVVQKRRGRRSSP